MTEIISLIALINMKAQIYELKVRNIPSDDTCTNLIFSSEMFLTTKDKPNTNYFYKYLLSLSYNKQNNFIPAHKTRIS